METDEKDYHIDTRLERLFHADGPRFNSENEREDDIMADTLPEWLIGVIVVIILLVIAFFVMVISTIIKNKRKNQSSDSCDINSTSRICDDLELGKISMVDPRTDVTTLEDEYKEPGENCAKSESTNDLAFSEPCCSSNSNDSPMCAYKNPLFVDDDPETELDEGDNSEDSRTNECPATETDSKSKGKPNKHKSSKHKPYNNLNSVREIREEEKDFPEESQAQEKTDSEAHSYSPQSDVDNLPSTIPQSDVADNYSEHVLIHKQDDVDLAVQSKPPTLDNDNSDRLSSSCNGSTDKFDCKDVSLKEGADHPTVENVDKKENVSVNGYHDTQKCQPENGKEEDPVSMRLNEDKTAVVTEKTEQNKHLRSSFIKMTLSEDGSEIENNERTFTKL